MPLVLATAMASASCRERPEGRDAGLVGRGDDRPDALGPQLGARVGRALGPAGVERRRRIALSAGPPSRRAPRRSPRSPRRARRARWMPSSSTRPDDATPTRRPFTNRRLTNASALATFWWISEFANRVSARLAGRRPAPRPRPRRACSAAWMTCSARRSASSGSPPIPCSVLIPSPPPGRSGTARPTRRGPTWPVWPGSPLPQFGVPHIRQLEASPTASIDRHSSYVMPV